MNKKFRLNWRETAWTLMTAVLFLSLSGKAYSYSLSANVWNAKTAPPEKHMIEFGISSSAYGLTWPYYQAQYSYGVTHNLTLGLGLVWGPPYEQPFSGYQSVIISPYIAFSPVSNQGIVPQVNVALSCGLYAAYSRFQLEPEFNLKLLWKLFPFLNPYLGVNADYSVLAEDWWNNAVYSAYIGNQFDFHDQFYLNLSVTWMGFNRPSRVFDMGDMILNPLPTPFQNGKWTMAVTVNWII